MIEKKKDQEGLILHVRSKTTVSLKDMLSGLELLQKDSSLPEEFRIFEDARNTTVTFGVEDIDTIAKNMNKTAHGFNMIKHAILHDSPNNTALTMLIREKTIGSNYILQVFSTKKSALNWLNSKIDNPIIELSEAI